MSDTERKRSLCQSCAMPLERPEDSGTDGNGCPVNDYCRHCYRNGRFTNPGITMPQTMDRCIRIMTRRQLMPEAQARSLMATVIPNLKRWQRKA